MTIAFNQIPSNLRTPFVFAEVDPSQGNSGQQNFVAALIGQILNTGSVVHTIATSAASTAPATTLTFASAGAIAGLQPGMNVVDRTAVSAVSAGTTILSIAGAVVTLSAALAGNVGLGDEIEFANLAPQLLTSQQQVNGLYGRGSMMSRLFGYYREGDAFGEVWSCPLVDDPASVKAAGTITVAGTVTTTAVIPLYVAGVSVPVVVTSAMTANQIATAIAAAINAAIDPVTGSLLPVGASATTAVVTLTALQAGLAGNDIDVRLAYFGAQAGEAIPTGLTFTLSSPTGAPSGSATLSSGATNPSTALPIQLAALPSRPFRFYGMPYGDTLSLNAFQAYMNDIVGEWAWSTMRYGSGFGFIRGTVGARQTAGLLRNDQHHCLMGAWDSPTEPVGWTGAFTAAAARTVRANPGASLNDQPLLGINPPPPASRDKITDQNTLLWSGISTYRADASGQVRIQKAITTYQLDVGGDPDDSMLEVETLFRVSYCLLYMRDTLTSKYAGALVVADGTRLGPGIKYLSPSIAIGELVAEYSVLEGMGLVQDSDGFAANVQAAINATNPRRLDVLWPGIMVNDLDIIAVLAQFRNTPFPSQTATTSSAIGAPPVS